MTENEFLAEVLLRCTQYGIFAFHSTDSRRDAGKGFPDLVLVGIHGPVLFVELKSATGKLSTEQVEWRYRILAAGGKWELWRPQDLSSGRIEVVLRKLGIS